MLEELIVVENSNSNPTDAYLSIVLKPQMNYLFLLL